MGSVFTRVQLQCSYTSDKLEAEVSVVVFLPWFPVQYIALKSWI